MLQVPRLVERRTYRLLVPLRGEVKDIAARASRSASTGRAPLGLAASLAFAATRSERRVEEASAHSTPAPRVWAVDAHPSDRTMQVSIESPTR